MLKTLLLVSYLITHPQGNKSPARFKVSSPAFKNQQQIPKDYTCQGKNISIPLQWEGVPKHTQSLAVIMMDLDVPRDEWYHWSLYNIPPDAKGLPADHRLMQPIQQAINSWGNLGYGGPCPSFGEHHYLIRIYALGTKLNKQHKLTTVELRRAMRKHIIATTQIVGRFKPPTAR